MNFHVVGQTGHCSLAVAQFLQLARGERAVRQPENPWRVEKVVAEERYCLQCCDVRWFDVIYPQCTLWKVLYRCRSCGKEGQGCEISG